MLSCYVLGYPFLGLIPSLDMGLEMPHVCMSGERIGIGIGRKKKKKIRRGRGRNIQ